MLPWNSSVIRRKGESQNRCCKKTKHVKFSEKRTFLTYWYAHVRVHNQGVRNVHFLENLACFVFLKHLFWDTPFYLITDEFYSITDFLPFFYQVFIRFLSGFSFLSEKRRISLEAITIFLFKVFLTLTWRRKHAFQIKSKK